MYIYIYIYIHTKFRREAPPRGCPRRCHRAARARGRPWERYTTTTTNNNNNNHNNNNNDK